MRFLSRISNVYISMKSAIIVLIFGFRLAQHPLNEMKSSLTVVKLYKPER